MSIKLNIPQAVKDAAEKMQKESRSFNWLVPEEADASRRNGIAKWTELVSVESAYRADANIGKKGQTGRTQLVVKFKGLPGDSPNAGKIRSLFMYFNFPFANGEQPDLGDGTADGESAMNEMTFVKLNAIATLAGCDATSGEDIDAMFPEEGTESILVGSQWALDLMDNARKVRDNGDHNQEIDGFHSVEE